MLPCNAGPSTVSDEAATCAALCGAAKTSGAAFDVWLLDWVHQRANASADAWLQQAGHYSQESINAGVRTECLVAC